MLKRKQAIASVRLTAANLFTTSLLHFYFFSRIFLVLPLFHFSLFFSNNSPPLLIPTFFFMLFLYFFLSLRPFKVVSRSRPLAFAPEKSNWPSNESCNGIRIRYPGVKLRVPVAFEVVASRCESFLESQGDRLRARGEERKVWRRRELRSRLKGESWRRGGGIFGVKALSFPHPKVSLESHLALLTASASRQTPERNRIPNRKPRKARRS